MVSAIAAASMFAIRGVEGAARSSTGGGRSVEALGAARVERHSVRFAARAQPLDWLLIAMINRAPFR